MKRLALLIGLLGVVSNAFAQVVTQQFTGVAASLTIDPFSTASPNGIFATPIGGKISGTFSVDLTTSSLIYSGTFSSATAEGTFDESGLGITIENGNPMEPLGIERLYFGNDSSNSASLLTITCPNSQFPVPPNFPYSIVGIFPVSIPTGCSASLELDIGEDPKYNGFIGEIYFTVTSLSGTTFVPAAPTLLDPTPLALPDPKQSLMLVNAAGKVGTSVTTNHKQLANGGRSIKGIAADGTAEIVLRIPVQSTNDTVTVTVLSDQCSTTDTPSTCAVSTNTAYDGGLLTLSDGSSPTVAGTSQMATGDENNFAYLIYRAPLDFVRYLGFPADPGLTIRPITFEVQYTSPNGTPYGVQYVPLSIVRPPTILIHGYAAAAADTWELFTPVTSNTLTKVYKVDYSAPVKVANTTPALCNSILCVTNFRQSDFGFEYNTPNVAMQIAVDLRDFASGNSPIREPVAVSQIDVVAHSMGGLIARYWTTSPDKAPYKTPDNYGKGYIHKLITLGTPVYGSPFATEGLSPNAGCFRDRSAYVHRYEIGSATLQDGKSMINGAVGELDGDGIGIRLNPSLQVIQDNAIKVPSYLIAGEIGPVSGYTHLIHVACLNLITPDPVASRMTPSLYNTLFDPHLTAATEELPGLPEVNDGVVPLSSALYSFRGAMSSSCTMDGNKCLPGDAHGGGTAELVGASKFLVDANAATLVEQILNISLNDSSVWITR